jgi:hypothetical protein
MGIITIGGIIYVFRPKPQIVTTPPSDHLITTTTNTKSSRPMMGQESFGIAVCDEVPKSVVEKAIGKTVESTEDKSSNDTTGCTYYTNKAKLEHILIQVSFLSAESQKKGQTVLDRTISTDNTIPMENFIATQENGQINAIYLVMAPNKFVRVDRTANTADNDQLITLAKAVALIITGK